MKMTQAGGSILAIPKVKTVLSSRYADWKLGQCIVTGTPLVWLKLGGCWSLSSHVLCVHDEAGCSSCRPGGCYYIKHQLRVNPSLRGLTRITPNIPKCNNIMSSLEYLV